LTGREWGVLSYNGVPGFTTSLGRQLKMGKHQSPGYFDHVSEVIVIIFKTYFEKDQNILTSSLSMGFLPIKLMIIIISTFSLFFIFFSTFV
jgi:hypothetical protein